MLNNSPSKQKFSIPKQARFPEIKSITKNVSVRTFDKISDFDLIALKQQKNDQYSFGSRHKRFYYYPQADKTGKVGPASYCSQQAFENSGSVT